MELCDEQVGTMNKKQYIDWKKYFNFLALVSI